MVTLCGGGGRRKNHVPRKPSGNMILWGVWGGLWMASGWPPVAAWGPRGPERSKGRFVFPVSAPSWGVLGVLLGYLVRFLAVLGRCSGPVGLSWSDPKALRGRLGSSGSGQSENATILQNQSGNQYISPPRALLGSLVRKEEESCSRKAVWEHDFVGCRGGGLLGLPRGSLRGRLGLPEG